MTQYYVYLLASYKKTLYTGVTNDLARRVEEHRRKGIEGFTSQYAVSKLVYYEVKEDVRSAIGREKEIKGWRLDKKVKLVEGMNPDWSDLGLRLGI